MLQRSGSVAEAGRSVNTEEAAAQSLAVCVVQTHTGSAILELY